MGFTSWPPTPTGINYRNVMLYIDGTNFLIEVGKSLGVKFDPHRPPEIAFDLAKIVREWVQNAEEGNVLIRAYWFGSYHGTDKERSDLSEALHKRGFQPRLLRKEKHGPEKGVDMALAIQMMMDASQNNFDTGWLVSGDKDYEELVGEVKRHRTVVNGLFLAGSTADDLRLRVDEFHKLEDNLLQHRDIPQLKIDLIRQLGVLPRTVPVSCLTCRCVREVPL
jgi:uncharacterized LabA/DUF88 family protein